MQRREFIKYAGILSLAALAGKSIIARAAAQPEDSNDLWLKILDYARWSPSPHNTQPWKVKLLNQREAELYIDPNRLLPVEDTDYKFIHVALGVFVENLSIVALHLGYELQCEFDFHALGHFSGSAPMKFGKLKLIASNRKETIDPELIKKRRTSRLPYEHRRPAAEILNAMKAVAAEHGHQFNWTQEQETVDWVMDLNKQTLFDDMDNAATRTELEKWLRYNHKQAEEHKDGLWSKCLHFPGAVVRKFYEKHEHYDHGEKKKLLEKLYRHSMRGTNTVGWMQGDFSDAEACVKAGRMMNRFWLTATQNGIYMHPFGSVITNKSAHGQLVARAANKADKDTWLLARFGYSKEPPRSYRLDLKDILI
jgi:hypothetical protein